MIGFPTVGPMTWPFGGGLTDLPGAAQAPTIGPNGTLIRYGISAPTVATPEAQDQRTAQGNAGASWSGAGTF